MGASCSIQVITDNFKCNKLSSIPDYSSITIKNNFPVLNDEQTFKEYILYAQKNNHKMQLFKFLAKNDFTLGGEINCMNFKTDVILTTGTKPFNVFARYAANQMVNIVDQSIIKNYSDEWMICYNKPENDEKWNHFENKNVSMCGPDENGPGHVFITTKDLNWKNFNIATIVLYKKINFLLKLKEVANEYVKQRGWKKAGFYFHCFPHNTVNSLHLHVVNEDAKYIGHMHEECKYKNLPLDVAIKVAQSL